MIRRIIRFSFICMAALFLFCSHAHAQFSISGQLRARGEFRNGYGTLKPAGSQKGAFVSQRTRLVMEYKLNRLIFHTTIQDVRLWGQDASTISNADGNKLGLHEAWAELVLAKKNDTSFKKPGLDYLALKFGRQELIYDDQRLLGSADWLQQSRRHDALVLKAVQKDWQVDLGAAFNQNTDAINYNGTFYTPANIPATLKDSKGNLVNTPSGYIPLVNSAGLSSKTGAPVFVNAPGTNGLNQEYKALEYLYIGRKLGRSRISGLFLTDQFGKYVLDSVKNTVNGSTGSIYGKHFNQNGLNTRYTTGLLSTIVFGMHDQWGINVSGYYQGGHDRDGLNLSACSYNYSLSLKTGDFGFTGGDDFASGNNAFSSSPANHRFDPLYGTPHKFHGTMDFFYAGNAAPLGGLTNPYLKIRFTSANQRFSTELANHYFFLSQNQKGSQGQAIDKFLGMEFDLTTSYKLNKFSTVELGLSDMAATRSMEYAKNAAPGTSRLNPFWAYLQFNIRPEFLNK